MLGTEHAVLADEARLRFVRNISGMTRKDFYGKEPENESPKIKHKRAHIHTPNADRKWHESNSLRLYEKSDY